MNFVPSQTYDGERFNARKHFITQNAPDLDLITPLEADCSTRTYYRLASSKHKRTKVLMDSPDVITMSQFEKIAHFLHSQGLKVPYIYASDPQGFLLLEDLGDTSYKIALQKAQNASSNPLSQKNTEQSERPHVSDASVAAAEIPQETTLWKEMFQVLAHLQKKTHIAHTPSSSHSESSAHVVNLNEPVLCTLPQMDHTELLREVEIFLDWGLSFQGQALGLNDKAHLLDLWSDFFSPLTFAFGAVVALKDFHTENLMRCTGDGLARTGILDFQDALIAEPAYDLVSLTEDVRLPFNAHQSEQKRLTFLRKHTHLPPEAFDVPYKILSLQRAIKIFGVFTRLALMEGRMHMLPYLPNVVSIIEARLETLEASPLKAWIESLGLRKRLQHLTIFQKPF